MSDRLALANAGIERAKAERVASVIFDAIHDNVATKADVQASEAALKADIRSSEAVLRADLRSSEAALKADLQSSEAALKADLQAIRGLVAGEAARLDTRIERLDAKVEMLASRTFNRLGALMAVVAGLLFAALHAWPPH